MRAGVRFSGRILREESGQDIVEYVFLIGFISLAALLVMINFGPAVNGLWTAITAVINVAIASMS